jgi:ribA/ribD-fused uncharacterized protein
LPPTTDDPANTGVSEPRTEVVTLPTAEHWMMLQKALLFNDIPVARQVLAITSTDKGSLLEVKNLGRAVSGFSEEVWNAHRSRIVLEGNLLKFRQNPDIRKKLLDTGNTTIVEASPRDRVWGIGFGEKNALEPGKKARWGLNLLGVALGEARRILREEEAAELKADSSV